MEDALDVSARDRVALARRLRVAMGCDDDADGSTAAPLQRGVAGEPPGGGRQQHFAERGLEAGEQRLGLRVAETCVELHDTEPPGRECESGVDEADEGGAAATEFVDGGLDHAVHHVGDEAGRCPRQGGVGAHAAGIGAGVAVPDPLEVLRWLERQHAGAVTEREKADLRPVQVVLDDHAPAAGSVPDGGVPVVGDDDALACGQPVVLHDVGGAELVQRSHHLAHVEAEPGVGSRDAGRLHDLLGEGLAALQLRRGCARTEDRDTAGTDGVRHACHQRRLGPDDDEIGCECRGEVGDSFAVHGVDGMVGADHCRAGIAGSDVDIGVAAEGPGERVLPSARSDHQYGQVSHAVILPRPEPLKDCPVRPARSTLEPPRGSVLVRTGPQEKKSAAIA